MAGNWKMHLTHLEAIALVQKLAFTLTDRDFDATEVAVLPPFTALRSVQTLVTGDKLRIRYGAQDISPYDEGAYTGDVSGPMLAKLACSYVLAGHSERRRYHGEDDATVNAKAKAALRSGITPIVCVGEDLAIRQAGDQIAHILAQLGRAFGDFDRVFIVAHQEMDVVAFHAAIAGLYVGAELFKGGADVRPAIGIVDGGGDVELFGHHTFLRLAPVRRTGRAASRLRDECAARDPARPVLRTGAKH